jgi:deoxyribonuclease-1-like protein
MKSNYITLLLVLLLISFSSCESRSKQNNIQKKDSSAKVINDENNKKNSRRSNFNSSNLTIATWNIRDLGRTKDAEEIHQIANILRDFDIVAIQEVVAKDPAGAQAVAKIADELNRMGSKWDYSISNPTKSPSANISERYAFLWKTSKVKIINKPYLDKELEDLCFREPYIAKFKLKKAEETFYVINYHSRKHYDKPEEEIVHFKDYLDRLDSKRIFIAGDFNLNEKHEVWNPLYNLGFKPSLRNTPTTLKTKCKSNNYLNHSIDNIYYNSSHIQQIQSGTIDFVEDCDNLSNARSLSDHLPVFIEFTF